MVLFAVNFCSISKPFSFSCFFELSFALSLDQCSFIFVPGLVMVN